MNTKNPSLKTNDIRFISLKEDFNKNKIKNLADWRLHQDIYLKKKETKVILQTHSTCATAVSSHRKSIPAFHYMIAIAGGNDIRCANYSTLGSKKFSINIIKALKNRSACLIANHGQIVIEKNLDKAFELAQEVENLCNLYINALRIGIPKILSKKEIKVVLGKMKNYNKG